MVKQYRPVTDEEINQLKNQFCRCDHWDTLLVSEPFNPAALYNVHFSGTVKLGQMNSVITLPTGQTIPSGILNASLYNCTIGDDVLIRSVHRVIANYDIEDHVIIDHVDQIVVEGETCFGNGVKVTVINEGGGREVPIFDQLSAPLAYLLASYRDRPVLIRKLEELVANYTRTRKSNRGMILTGAKICSAGIIKNTFIGSHVTIEGVTLLNNVSVNSTALSPTTIGCGVIAKDTIFLSGSTVTEQVNLDKCFVGQSVELSKQFAAENSLFFANTSCYLGEACSVFAGPYTVSHHKSSLLIAGMVSFFNAGSGSNQSNHHYKLGPVHQGVLDRGCKTASDSYLLWPARVGAYSTVVGRHYQHCDLSSFPFSFLVERQGKSYLVPGIALRSIGPLRDLVKWPSRDRRADDNRLDPIIFEMLSPYTIQHCVKGLRLLHGIQANADDESEFTWSGIHIKHSSMKSGLAFYQLAIDMFIADRLMRQLDHAGRLTSAMVEALFKGISEDGVGEWVDLAGLLMPKFSLNKLIADVESGKVTDLDVVYSRFEKAYTSYEVDEWSWICDYLRRRFGNSLNKSHAMNLIKAGVDAREKVLSLQLQDGRKDFTPSNQHSYGLSGDESQRELDFVAVRGHYEEHDFINEVRQQGSNWKKLAMNWLGKLENVR